ncbi:ABC transporter ATP-binding protein [bacterium]|nr:ABC transporter ATP-binding protein [bacterium]
MDKILEIKNLSVGFNIEDNFYYALNNINISFEKGKIHAIAGESGCGKSVLINTILKLLPKNGIIKNGEINFQNKNLINLKEKDFKKIRGNKISLIPQDPFMSLNPLYTIENQLMEIPILKNNKDSKNIIRKSLEEVKIKNIETVLKSYPHELSGGMKQRVIISMALISNSELILADEPTTALDVTVSNSILNLLLELKEKGKTIILITHDLSIVSNYCDTCTIMYLGNIVENAATNDIFKQPKHPYTKALLNALPTLKGKKLENIKGQISPITEKIEGCKFHPRCNFAMEICKLNKPELKNVDNSSCACFLY